MTPENDLFVRNTRVEDFDAIIEMTRLIYPDARPWTAEQLSSHLNVFPEGQFVAVHQPTGQIAGMAASLIVKWDDYEVTDSWVEFTESGMFTTHDPDEGRTLYGAEVMVHPSMRRRGIGSLIYEARFDLARRLNLLRIRAGARLAGYHRVAESMSAREYVLGIINGSITDPTLSFQLKNGFHVIAVVQNYLARDPASLGYAAIIEWINPEVADEATLANAKARFQSAT